MDIISQVVLAALRVHPARSIGQAELAGWAGCTNRQVRAAIADLRRQGWLIMGNGSGYYFARNIDEVHRFLARIADQICQLEDLRAALYQAARVRFDQGVCTGGQDEFTSQTKSIPVRRLPGAQAVADCDEPGQDHPV